MADSTSLIDSTGTEPSVNPRCATLQCPRCRGVLMLHDESSAIDEKCPVCQAEVSLSIYPRLFREVSSENTFKLSDGDDATCSFYPDLKAENICDACGSFMSERATVSWSDRKYCLPCLHRLREVEPSSDFKASAKLYDKRALALVTLLAPLTLFTAPLALFLLLRYRKDRSGFVPRSGGTWWIALILSLLWIAGWTTLLVIWVSLIVEGIS